MKVLVVDDSSSMRKIIASYIRQLGTQAIDEAADGAEAVAMCASGGYDLVLMDWNMPNMLGIDALKAIRATGNGVPVIMVTTESEKLKLLEAIRCGANGYVIKPILKEKFLEAVQKTLARKT